MSHTGGIGYLSSTVNRPLLRGIACAIVDTPLLFDMDAFCVNRECGYVHCIGGWAVALSPNMEYPIFRDNGSWMDSACKALLIEEVHGKNLFCPDVHTFWGQLIRDRNNDFKGHTGLWRWMTNHPEDVARGLHDLADGVIDMDRFGYLVYINA